MNRKADPCEDFYDYACGNWLKTHVIPKDAYSYSRYTETVDLVNLRLKVLLEKPFDKKTESESVRKAKNFYESCMNEELLKNVGTSPLRRLINQLGEWPLLSTGSKVPQPFDLLSAMVKLAWVRSLPLFWISVDQDLKNSFVYIAQITQPSFGILRDVLLKGSNSSEVLTYRELLRQLAIQVLGLKESSQLDSDISEVVDFEIQLAGVSASTAEVWNFQKYYKKLTISELQSTIPAFQWLEFLTKYYGRFNVRVTKDTEVVVFSMDYLKAMFAIRDSYVRQNRTRVLANYLLMRTVLLFYRFLHKSIRDLRTPLYKEVYGASRDVERWKLCVEELRGPVMAMSVGQLYVQNHFPSTAKQKALEIVRYIRESVKQLIIRATWMDAATTKKALDKVNGMVYKIGYPDDQFNEKAMEESYGDVDYKTDTFFENIMEYYRWAVKHNALRLKNKPDKTKWVKSAATLNAWYEPAANTLALTAGIMNPPLFAEDFPVSMMFGGMGTMIAQKMTHGFDDQASDSGKDGKNDPLWSDYTMQHYRNRSKCFVDQYSQEVVAGGRVNGRLTLRENIADNGGLRASYMAFVDWQKNNLKEAPLPGLNLTHNQLFFLNFAQGWCTHILDAAAKSKLTTSLYSPAHIRVKLPLTNMPEFAQAFQCPAGSAMTTNERCRLW